MTKFHGTFWQELPLACLFQHISNFHSVLQRSTNILRVRVTLAGELLLGRMMYTQTIRNSKGSSSRCMAYTCSDKGVSPTKRRDSGRLRS